MSHLVLGKNCKIKVLFAHGDTDDTNQSPALKKILNQGYTSGIDRIVAYGKSAKTNNVVGEFEANGTRFYFSIDPKKGTFSYAPAKAKVSNLDAAKAKAGAKTAVNKAGKTLTCTPGKTYPCGAVCRAMEKPCKRMPMSPQMQQTAKQVAAAISASPKTPEAAPTVLAKTKAKTKAKKPEPSPDLPDFDFPDEAPIAPGHEARRYGIPDYLSAEMNEGSNRSLGLSSIGNMMILPSDELKYNPSPNNQNTAKEIDEAAKVIKKANNNWIPVMVRETGPDAYEVVGNSLIYEATLKAGARFIRAIIIEDNDEAIESLKYFSDKKLR